MKVDLHIHTTASDGTYEPGRLVSLAAEQGFDVIAITDHDTMAGIAPAMAAGVGRGIKVIPGVELSVQAASSIHLLGYGLDPQRRELDDMLALLRSQRLDRTLEILKKLEAVGIPLLLSQVEAYSNGGAMGRPHVAMALVEMGYCTTLQDAFMRFLSPGGAAYVPKVKPSAQTAIDMVRRAGGIPVLAHPGLMPLSFTAMRSLIESLVQRGLMGLEVWYPAHTPGQVDNFTRWAEQLGLVKTGGSDFHGTIKPNVSLGCGTGMAPVGWYEPFIEVLHDNRLADQRTGLKPEMED